MHSQHTRHLASTVAWCTIAACGVSACGRDGPTPPPVAVQCAEADVPIRALAPFGSALVRGDSLDCVLLAGAGASYIIAAQLTGPALPYGGYGYRIGDPEAEGLQSTPVLSRERSTSPPSPFEWRDAQSRMDARLRASETTAARALEAARLRARGPLRTSASAPTAPVGTMRRFSVLSTLSDTVAFAAADARLVYAGQHVRLWLDTAALAAMSGAQLSAFGATFDEVLYGIATDAFGAPSDIDGDGYVNVLLTPVVNRLVSASQCETSGYVRGFFFAHDLADTGPTSNVGEVFYAYVPDPEGRWSCPHDATEVLPNIAPTFIHELQHMISYGQHVLARGGEPEEPWLNEGLSHLAEELGSVYFERRYPAPAGRTNAAQLFPDSAAPFITPNLLYAHRYLFLSAQYSATGCAPGTFCTLPERAATWLFLRWLGDQKGESIYRSLVATSRRGIANVEAAAGEPASMLLGDFALATWADSITGIRRDAVAPRHRFSSRSFRLLYRALYDAYGPSGGVARPFPVEPISLAPATSRTGTMRPGSFAMYRIDTPRGMPAVALRFSLPDGAPFATTTGAQLAIFRTPPP